MNNSQDARTPKPHPAKRKRCQHADHHGDRHNAKRHDRCVPEERQKVGLRQQDFELIERNPVGDDPWIRRHMRDLGVTLERRDDHVIGRDQKEDREQH
jgi:hypothetical protein